MRKECLIVLCALQLCFIGCQKENIPTLITTEITCITEASAVSGGTITDEGSSPIITRGVCWGTNIAPTIKNSKTQDGTGAGSFASNITGLKGGTIYYLRAYASNNEGTGYGMAISFNTLDDKAHIEEDLIHQYIIENPTLSFQLKTSGLYYLDLKIGSGPAPVLHDTAYVRYTGKFLDGTIFDTNAGSADMLKFPVGENLMITGFDEGILYMKEGGKALFLTPSKLAYGSSGYYIIPAYTPLLWEVDLVKVGKR